MDAVNLADIMKDADLVVTGEGRIDSQTIHGKTPIGVARTAKQFDLPVIAIAGSTAADCAVVYDHGIDAAYSVVLGATDLPTALKEAAFNVQMTSRNVAKALSITL